MCIRDRSVICGVVYCIGLVHAVNVAPSKEHSRWSTPTPPVSLPENSNITEFDFVLLLLVIVMLFPSMAVVIFVVGGIVSTFQVNNSGERSLLPTLSLENTLNSWGPSVM